ncbi:VCBS repeat-containing protein [Candidatus Saccharibacteria bacterium]|nr:MAG: VCBS repeat-containing protein [Candidatus Saccharibacteria bacterium]
MEVVEYQYCRKGDFNGDGYADLAVTSTYPDGQSFNLWLFPGSATGLGDPVFQQHFSSSQYWMIPNIKFSVANINGDSYVDLVMFAANAYDGVTIVQISGSSSALTASPVVKRSISRARGGSGQICSQ